MYKTLWESNKYNIILVSGRNEKDRKVTEAWFVWHHIPFSKIYMRSDNDFRADHIIKEEMLEKLQKEGHDILFVVDDRKQVVDMWRRRGVVCLYCDEGNF